MASTPSQSGRQWLAWAIPTLPERLYRRRVKNVLLGLGMAMVLALGGVGAANLAAGADRHGHEPEHAPEQGQHETPSDPRQSGSQHSTHMRALAQSHRDGMRAWQQCPQAGRASCQKPGPPGW